MNRLIWADATKGICIGLVVLAHAVGLNSTLSVSSSFDIDTLLSTLLLSIYPLRVPLFFVISGLFAANAILRPWSAIFRSKVLNHIYVYAVWVIILTAIFTYVLDFPFSGNPYYWANLASVFIYPANHIWYMYALAIYFVLAKIFTLLPFWIGLLLSTALSIVSGTLTDLLPANVMRNLIFYMLGAYAPLLIKKLASNPCRAYLLVTAATYGSVAFTVRFFGIGELPGVNLILSAAGICFGLQAMSYACKFERLSRIPVSLGKNTLWVYVMHFPLLVGCLHFTNMLTANLNAHTGTIIHLLFPLISTLIAIGLAMLGHYLLGMVGIEKYLFRLPNGHSSTKNGALWWKPTTRVR